ncbi:MBL fold metallo-hydrolase [Longispora urticae]
MRLTVVGCAGSTTGPDSACSSYLVEEDGHRLLLDLGAGASGPLQRYADPLDIGTLILSHAHSDHWGDTTQLGYHRARAGRPVTVIGPSDMHEVLTTNPDTFDTTVATAGDRRIGPFAVRLGRVRHGDVECWGTRIGDALCYTADTEPCPEIDELAAGCRVLLAGASGLDADGPLRGHLTAGDAARLAARSGARLLVLTHLRAWQDPLALLDEAAAIAGCQVVLATPGLRIAL